VVSRSQKSFATHFEQHNNIVVHNFSTECSALLIEFRALSTEWRALVSKTKTFALTSEHIHQQNVHESELRFPNREDLMMEEDIEFKIHDIVRKIPLGTCKGGATFGEELAGKTGFCFRAVHV